MISVVRVLRSWRVVLLMPTAAVMSTLSPTFRSQAPSVLPTTPLYSWMLLVPSLKVTLGLEYAPLLS